MGNINVSRVILGGIVAGIVANVFSYIVDGVILAPQWAAGMKALGKSDFTTNQILGFLALGLASGVFTIWLYAAIRPRYGAGPKTAVFAGVAAWFAGALLPNVAFMSVVGLYAADLTTMTTIGGLVGSIAGALAGAALYQEGAAAATT